MKQQVKTPVVVIAVVALAALLYGFGSKAMSSAGGLDQGQVKYTPGKPPWLDKAQGKGTALPSASPMGASNVDNTPH